MYWGIFWQALTLATFPFVLKNKPAGIALFGLALWSLLEKVIYEKGAVESEGTFYITIAYCIYCVLSYLVVRSYLILWCLLIGYLTLLWAMFYGGSDAYLFKAIKNGLYGLALGAIWLSLWSTSRKPPSLRA